MKTDSTVEVPFQPPKSWGELVTSRDFLNVWFSTHGIVRRDAELANLSSNCIQQICSLKGSVFSSIELEAKWTIDIIQLLQELLKINILEFVNFVKMEILDLFKKSVLHIFIKSYK